MSYTELVGLVLGAGLETDRGVDRLVVGVAQRGGNVERVDGLDDERAGAAGERPADVVVRGGGGEHDHLDAGMLLLVGGKAANLDPLSLPVELQTALEALYGHYAQTFDLWQQSGIFGRLLCDNEYALLTNKAELASCLYANSKLKHALPRRNAQHVGN